MWFALEKRAQWSKIGLLISLVSVAATVVLSLLDGKLRGQEFSLSMGGYANAVVWVTWVYDFRAIFEQLIYVGAIVFVGGKFIETRNIITVGFDRLDAADVSLKGPDEEHVVWVGRRYRSQMEAAAVADAIKSRLRESAD